MQPTDNSRNIPGRAVCPGALWCCSACESTTYMLESAYNIRGMQSSTRLSLLQEFVSYLRELSPRHSNYATTLDSRDNAKRRRHHRKKRKKKVRFRHL